MSYQAKVRALVAAGALVAMLLGSCGIDFVSTLDPPRSIVGATGFRANDDPGDGYLGVAAAYRIYDTRDQASADVARLRQRQDAAGAVPGDAIQAFLLSPNGLRYKPLIIANAPASPTFRASLIALHDATLEWSIGRQVVAKIDSVDYVLERSSKSFSTAPIEGDEDYTKSGESGEPNAEFFLQVIVYSFGADLVNASLRDLFSIGVELDLLRIHYD